MIFGKVVLDVGTMMTSSIILLRLSVESGGFPSSDGEIEFAKEEQDPRAKGRERPQPPCIRDDPGNQ